MRRSSRPRHSTITNEVISVKNKDVLLQVLYVFLFEAVCIGLMLLIYGLSKKLDLSVIYGALAGGLLAIGNFFFLSVSVCHAVDCAEEEKNDTAAQKAALAVQRNSVLRKIILIGLYILLFKSGYFNILSALLPLVFVQAGVYVLGFFRKDGAR